jgi:hypothetical protein
MHVWRVRLRYRQRPEVAAQERLAQARWIEDVLAGASRVLVYADGLSVQLQVEAGSEPAAVVLAEARLEDVVGDSRRVLGQVSVASVRPEATLAT